MTENSLNSFDVLVVTGGFITEAEDSIYHGFKKLLLQKKHAEYDGLDKKINFAVAELMLKSRWNQLKSNSRDEVVSVIKNKYLKNNADPLPDLSSVTLMTLLSEQNVSFQVSSYHELLRNPKLAERLLTQTRCVFASTTLLHDLSELDPLLQVISLPHNKIIIGGALLGALPKDWPGHPDVDVAAVGYGEYLIPELVKWLKSDFQDLTYPNHGWIEKRAYSKFVFSGSPQSKDLDWISKPDWVLAGEVHKRQFDKVYYESVRGCPYRCSFCNYPYLFNDKKFRLKSATKIAEDWLAYEKSGVCTVICLDSLFTVPKKRVLELCDQLIARGSALKWVCYARADDLADLELVKHLRRAGLVQVQIGVESADKTILDNMNKNCRLQENIKAIENCREVGITTVISLVVGFPGESRLSLDKTFQFLCEHPPDFYYPATFSTRVESAPVLNAENRSRFGLESMSGYRASAPYWRHDTMSCIEAVNLVREFNQKVMVNRASLNGALFFPGMLDYNPYDRKALLDLQYQIATQGSLISKVFNTIHQRVDQEIEEDMRELFSLA
ncbi:MAG: radical SAM protein [Gammaproteobacteria bacterium]|nr:radical SAM protein [Gammaproteobacteria bacterium]